MLYLNSLIGTEMSPEIEKVAKLIRKGAIDNISEYLQNPSFNINELDPKSGKSLLQIAMQSEERQIFRMLLKRENINLTISSRDGESPLETAILLNSIEFVQQLLSNKNKHINPRKKSVKGQSSLQIAIKNKISPEIIGKLVQHNYDINEKIAEHGSLLNLAIIYDRFENFKFLLQERHIDLKVLDEHGNTALMLAVKGKKADYIAALFEKLGDECILNHIEKQFFVNAQDEDGNTALILAAIADHQTILEMLVREGQKYGIDEQLSNRGGKNYRDIIEEREVARKNQLMSQLKRKQEKVIRQREKEEEKVRKYKEEERTRVLEKKLKKQEEARAVQKLKQHTETTQKKHLWACGIMAVLILGCMYLLILRQIGKNKSNTQL